jgi:tricorn protease
MRPLLCALALLFAATTAVAAEPTLLLRAPTVSSDHLAFVHGGDVWLAGRDGSSPRRLTVHAGVEADPHLSPDGQLVAFTGRYDGNVDVFVVPTVGGQPTRLTWHPADDMVRGWTPGGDVLFISPRASHTRRNKQLYRVGTGGGFPEQLPIPKAQRASMSPDGARVAYTPLRDAFEGWKHYRGGRTTPIWVIELATGQSVEIPHVNASDSHPTWLGDTVWFLSDREGTMNVFAWGPDGAVRQVTRHDDFDVKALSGGGGVLVYEQAGRLHELDPTTGSSSPIAVTVLPDAPLLRPRFVDGADQIANASISPTGVRVLVEARGDVFTVPTEQGDVRNLTRTPGVAERDPAWSPDGSKIAWLSDASGEYQLVIADQAGRSEPRTVSLGDPTFYYGPLWSPDGQRIAYTDKKLQLWILDVDRGEPVLVDTDTYDKPPRSLDPSWSPDGRWLTYTKRLPNHLRAVFLFDVQAGTSHQVTDGMSDCRHAVFSRDGHHLLFAASTNFALNTGWLDMSSYERPIRRSIYAIVLAADQASPLAPRSDEEPVTTTEGKGKAKADDAEDAPVVVTVDLEGIDQRIVALPIPEGNLSSLASADGALFFLEAAPPQRIWWDSPGGQVLQRYDWDERETKAFGEGIADFEVSHDGTKVLYVAAGGAIGVAPADAESVTAAEGEIDLSGLVLSVDPRAEFRQMYEETFRIQRDFFYDPNMHGIDWDAVHDRYLPWLDHVAHRDDLSYLIVEMIGELVVGHAYRWGGDYPEIDEIGVGLLGADLVAEGDRYRIARIYTGQNWNPELRAPLTEPGVRVEQGDYLLAIDGRELRAPDNPWRLLQGRDGLQVRLTVNSKPTTRGARDVTVVPVADEQGLRHFAWVEGNRARVHEATGGRVAYVYVPNTSWAGYVHFNRYYYAQLDRQAVIVDERFNGGGSVADYMIDMLGRTSLNWNVTREGADYSSPVGAIDGPKVMIINEDAGSGGDCLPLYFRMRSMGKLVGKRTWGGLIGIYDYPQLIDGGLVTAPRIAFYGPDGWSAENTGIAPDVEVEMTPSAVLAGQDPQLEAAIEVILEELETNPPSAPERPPFPDYGE